MSWDGQSIPGATGSAALPEDVKANGALALRMMVAPPSGSGVFRCAFTLKNGEQTALLHTNPTTMAMPICHGQLAPGEILFVDLQQAFNGEAASAETMIVARRRGWQRQFLSA